MNLCDKGIFFWFLGLGVSLFCGSGSHRNPSMVFRRYGQMVVDGMNICGLLVGAHGTIGMFTYHYLITHTMRVRQIPRVISVHLERPHPLVSYLQLYSRLFAIRTSLPNHKQNSDSVQKNLFCKKIRPDLEKVYLVHFKLIDFSLNSENNTTKHINNRSSYCIMEVDLQQNQFFMKTRIIC